MNTIKFCYAKKIGSFLKKNLDTKRFIVVAGGRGKAATYSFMTLGIQESFRITHGVLLFTREIKDSIDQSTKERLEFLIKDYNLDRYFQVKDKEIVNKQTGTKFIFNGLSSVTENAVKGSENIDICHIGEAHSIKKTPIQKLFPTIRKRGSRIWVDYNPENGSDAIHQYFTARPEKYPYGASRKVKRLAYLLTDYRDNELITPELLEQMETDKRIYDRKDFEWIWYGKLKESIERHLFLREDVVAATERRLIDTLTPPVVGADIAHMGGDYIVFYYRRGNQIVKKFKKRKMRAPDTVAELEAFMDYDTSIPLAIDNGHIGAAVADYMEAKGYSVHRFDFGSTDKKKMLFDSVHSYDVNTDMARNLAARIKELSLQCEEDIEIIDQLSQREWDFVKGDSGVIKEESKPDFKVHYTGKQKSPDDGDALKLCSYIENYGTPVDLGYAYT